MANEMKWSGFDARREKEREKEKENTERFVVGQKMTKMILNKTEI